MAQKKVFDDFETARTWVARARTYREGYYMGDGYETGKIMCVAGSQRSVSVTPVSMQASWSLTETLRERMGLDPPGRGTMARLAGSATSPEKAASSRANGRKYGGRTGAGAGLRETGEARKPRTYTLSVEAIKMIKVKAGCNASAYIESLIRQDAEAAGVAVGGESK